jgi:rare lipoprotein A
VIVHSVEYGVWMRGAFPAASDGEGKSSDFRVFARLATLAATALILAACSGKSAIDPRLGVSASPKLVEEGKPVPKGGGRAQVGKPYQVAGKTYHPDGDPTGYSVEGLASWYGSAFHGRMTANGEIFDMEALSAAHPTMPLPSYARVTNTNNGKSIVVRVNDRGPFHGERALDVSKRVAEVLDFKQRGMARVRIDYVGPASLKGSDDAKLMATYRENSMAPNTAIAGLDPMAGTQAPHQSYPVAYRDPPLPGVGRPQPQLPSQPQQQTAYNAPPNTPVDVSARVDAGFGGMTSPQPLTQQGSGSLVQPVLSGFAFNPSALSGLR